jgi:hypothetical protein
MGLRGAKCPFVWSTRQLLGIIGPVLLDKVDSSHYVNFHVGQSLLVLGTSEVRQGLMVGYGYGREDRQLRYKNVPAQMVHYLHYLRGSGEFSPEPADAFGYAAIARYRFPTNGKVGAYLDLGWGVQYTTRTSEDIDSHWNSTPYLGFGIARKSGDGEFLVGLAWLHVSNGGTHGSNHGQNYLHLTFSYRY